MQDRLIEGKYRKNFFNVRSVTWKVYNQWLQYGSNSPFDPTGGATSFSIATPAQRFSYDTDVDNNRQTQKNRERWWRWKKSCWQYKQRFGFDEKVNYSYRYEKIEAPELKGTRYMLLSNKDFFTPYLGSGCGP